MSLAWEVTDDDIEMALDELGLSSSSEDIENARDHLRPDLVERAALSSTDFDEQFELAQTELKQQLSEALVTSEQ